MPLLLLCLFHLCTKNPLHNDGSIILCVIFAKANTIIFCVFIVLLYIRSANVTTIFCNNICPLTRAIPHHMANPMAAMALNPSGAARRSTLGRFLGTLGWCGRLHCCWCCRRHPRADGGGAVRALEKVGLVRVAPVVVRGVKETPVLRAFCCYRRPCNSFSARQASWKQRLTVVYSL